MIEQSSNEVKGGSKLVSDAADRLTSMLEGVRENSELIDGIAQASQEQSSSIAQVSAAIRQMDEMTQHNAALVEETNAAIEQTEAQAVELDGIVGIFTLGAEVAGDKRTTPVAPAPAGVKGLQKRVAAAAKSYLSRGNAAVAKDWSEF